MEKANNKFFSSVVKGTLLSVIIALFLVLIFALVIRLLMPANSIIKVVNQFIKIVAIFIGCFIFIKNNLGLIKGGLVGLGFALLINLVFLIIGGNVTFSVNFLLDLVLCIIIGIVCGVLSVNIKGKES